MPFSSFYSTSSGFGKSYSETMLERPEQCRKSAEQCRMLPERIGSPPLLQSMPFCSGHITLKLPCLKPTHAIFCSPMLGARLVDKKATFKYMYGSGTQSILPECWARDWRTIACFLLLFFFVFEQKHEAVRQVYFPSARHEIGGKM